MKVCIQQVDKRNDCFSVDGFRFHCKTVFETMACFYSFRSCQEVRHPLTEDDIQRGIKKKELDGLIRNYEKGRGCNVLEVRECE